MATAIWFGQQLYRNISHWLNAKNHVFYSYRSVIAFFIPTQKPREGNLLTLHNELHQGFSWLHVESIILAGLASVHAWHFPWHVYNPECSIVTLHLHRPIRHCNFFICSRPKDDWFGFASYLTLKFYCVSFSGDQRWFFLWNSQIGWNLKWEKENFSRLV